MATPSILVQKRLPDRTISEDMRLIADLRSVNLYTMKEDYRKMAAPSIQTIAKRVALLKRKFPGKEIVCTKRDIDSAFRRISIRPEAAIIMCAELVGKDLGVYDDCVCFYLALPFGWNGSPGIFALAGDYVKAVIGGYRSQTPQWESSMPFSVEIFVDDIMAIEPRIGRRPEMVVGSAEWVVNQSLGFNAISAAKKKEEGHWSVEHILLGFTVNVDSGVITLPDEKIAGSKRLIQSHMYDPGSRILSLKSLQELRGRYTHWAMAQPAWTFIARPADLLLACVGDLGVWIQCDILETWIAFWNTIEWLRETSEDEEAWAALFKGKLDRCLPLNIRLSGNLDLPPVLWISSDATLKRIGVINWRVKQFMCLPIGELFDPFAGDSVRAINISDGELMAIALGVVVWATGFAGATIGISDNLNALHWIASKKAQFGVALQILRTTMRWIVKKNLDFAGLYSRSHHNVSADHLTRLRYEEICRWAKHHGFEWVCPTLSMSIGEIS